MNFVIAYVGQFTARKIVYRRRDAIILSRNCNLLELAMHSITQSYTKKNCLQLIVVDDLALIFTLINIADAQFNAICEKKIDKQNYYKRTITTLESKI